MWYSGGDQAREGEAMSVRGALHLNTPGLAN